MKRSYSLLILFIFIVFRVNGQVAGSFEVITMKWRWTATTNQYLKANGFTTQARITGHNIIYGSGNPRRANLTQVRAWLAQEFPKASSTGYLIISWETGPYRIMRNNPPTSAAFRAAESEVLRLLNAVKKFRPRVKVGMYMLPYRFWLQTQSKFYNKPGKFNKIFARTDFLAPSYYILQADEEVGHARNLQYIRENLVVALKYGKELRKPVIPFLWHRVHPTESVRYDGEIIQREVFAKYVKYIATYSYNNYRAAGVWWYDNLGDQLKDLSGINNFLRGTVYNKTTYNVMIVSMAKQIKKVLHEKTKPTPDVTDHRIVSFSVINTTNDRSTRTLTNGMALHLNRLRTRQINIRADTYPRNVGRVKFTLSGPQNHRQTESEAPYALFGNDGDGSSYRPWTPVPGQYALKATPYDGSGTAGPPLTVTFTVVDPVANAAEPVAALALPPALDSTAPAPKDVAPAVPSALIYPNPATTTLTIKVPAATGVAVVQLYNYAGLVVLTQEVATTAAGLNTELDVSRLPKGVYILKLDAPQTDRTTRRILIE